MEDNIDCWSVLCSHLIFNFCWIIWGVLLFRFGILRRVTLLNNHLSPTPTTNKNLKDWEGPLLGGPVTLL